MPLPTPTPQERPASRASSSDDLGAIQCLREPARILHLLEQLLGRRSLLTVRFDKEGASFSSALLRVDRSTGLMLLDELTPDAGHRRVGVDTRLLIGARLDGVFLDFEAPVQRVGSHASVAYYQAPIPRSLDYHQRRAHYRAEVGRGLEVPVSLRLAEHIRVDGELHDISAGGAAIRLTRHALELLNPLGPPVECEIHLPDGQCIACRIQVRYTVHGPRRGAGVAGAKFLDLGQRDLARVHRFVAELDRELAKRRLR